MALLDVTGLTKQYGEDHTVFNDITFQIQPHQKVGLIGVNGAGKSTLFRMLIGEETPEQGQIRFHKETKIGYLEQHTCQHLERTVFDEALSVFEPLILMEQELEQLQHQIAAGCDLDQTVKKQFFLQEKYENEGGFVFRSKTRGALLGMGFSEDDFNRPVAQMSGGQKTRIALVKLLLSQANFLLLDEPTNHLDLFSCRWLEEYLKNYSGAVLLISHDRYFLDQITNTTMEIEQRQIKIYPGNYSTAMQLKEERALAEKKQNESLKREIEKTEKSIAQFRQWNREKSIKRARNMEKREERLKASLTEMQTEVKPMKMTLQIDRVSGNDVLYINQLSKSYDGKVLFQNFDLLLKRQERIFLLGANGCGKTTLFRILTEEETADTGMFKFGTQVSVGYYRQDLRFLDEQKTLFEEIQDAYPEMKNSEIRKQLGRFLFFDDDVFKPLKTLSGGERARIHLLKLMLKRPNVLLLDEPTNHLDIASREVMEKALSDFEGTLFVISHDRYFINKLANRILYMENGAVFQFDGNYDYFSEHFRPAEPITVKKEVSYSQNAVTYKEQKMNKAILKKCHSDIKKTEEKIGLLEQEIALLEDKTQSGEILSDYVKLTELSELIQQKNEELEQLYNEWEALQRQLSEIQAE